MPSRRRQSAISAAALPASRLPLGTPQLPTPRSHIRAHLSNRPPTTPESSNSSPSSEKERPSESQRHPNHSGHSMPPKNPPKPAPTTSLADAKLERQRKRIEEADAALTAIPPPPDKPSLASRGKGKQWKPFAFAAEPAHAAQLRDGGVPLLEDGAGPFRVPSRAASLSRSASVLSHRTSEAGASDMDRTDSALTDGFQLIRGRKSKRTAGELNAYESQPEDRQSTVEATFDKRDVYQVFGNALPGQDFIQVHVGHLNGQLQFIQHPNGDVSAHQWSQPRYMWENIGQFSNIRKRVEGQLAADRLKGETASQTLQQNTLAYFRTVAKQREAHIMSLPFGPKEIQAAMPEKSAEPAPAPTGLKQSAADTGSPVSHRSKPEPPSWSTHGHGRAEEEHSNTHIHRLNFLQPPPQGPRSTHYNYYTPSYGQQAARQDDPFCSASTYQQIYGGYTYGQAYSNQAAGAAHFPGLGDPSLGARAPLGLNYDFHFPPPNAASRAGPQHGPPSCQDDVPSFTKKNETASHQIHETPSLGKDGRAYPQPPVRGRNNQAEVSNTRITTGGGGGATRPKPATPLISRTAMSDQLWKISANAKERSLSQTNTPSRTVLYDPLQNVHPVMKTEPPMALTNQVFSPTFSKHVVGKTLRPASLSDLNSDNYFPTVLAPQIDPAESSVKDSVLNSLGKSSPDTHWNNKSRGVSFPDAPSNFYHAPPMFGDPFSTDRRGLDYLSHTNATPANGNTKSYDEELKDWWTSGNKFSRQEEFYQSIIASQKQNDTTSTTPTHFTSIATAARQPHQKQDDHAVNTTTSRLLIPVLENLASYVQGPANQRRDYWCQWPAPPEWCIDRSETGNHSFFDSSWGQPPARVGRDPRYSNRPWLGEMQECVSRPGAPPSHSRYASHLAVGSGLDKRFGFAG